MIHKLLRTCMLHTYVYVTTHSRRWRQHKSRSGDNREYVWNIGSVLCCVGKQRTKRRETISIHIFLSLSCNLHFYLFFFLLIRFSRRSLFVWMGKKEESHVSNEKRANNICGVLGYINLTVYDLITFSATGVGWFLWLFPSHRCYIY